MPRWGTGPFWAPVYGAPLQVGGLRGLVKGEALTNQFNTHRKKMNRYPDKASTYKVRRVVLLVSHLRAWPD